MFLNSQCRVDHELHKLSSRPSANDLTTYNAYRRYHPPEGLSDDGFRQAPATDNLRANTDQTTDGLHSLALVIVRVHGDDRFRVRGHGLHVLRILAAFLALQRTAVHVPAKKEKQRETREGPRGRSTDGSCAFATRRKRERARHGNSLLVAFQVRGLPGLVGRRAAVSAHRPLRVELVVTLSLRRHSAYRPADTVHVIVCGERAINRLDPVTRTRWLG